MSSPMPESDSDDDLPDLFKIFLSTPKSKEIRSGDIVWCRYKKVHWPAYVTNVYRKEKKITFWFTDQPGTIFKLPLSKVYPFCTEKCKEFRKAAISEGCVAEYDELESYASIYLNRSSQGFKDDPLKYFDPTHPYLLIEDYLKKNPTASRDSFTDLKIPHVLTRRKIPEYASSSAAGSIEADNDDFDAEFELVAKSDDVDQSMENLGQESRFHALIFQETEELSSRERSDMNEIIQSIMAGKTNAYLLDLLHGKIQSFYYYFYLKTIKSDKRLLNYISHGPIENLDDLREIVTFLISLYYDHISDIGQKQTKSLSHPTSSPLDNASFISSVWLPESIIFAMSEVKKLSLQDAYNLFHVTSRLKCDYLKYVETETRPSRNKRNPRSSLKTQNDKVCENVILTKTNDEAYESRNQLLIDNVLEEVNKISSKFSKSNNDRNLSKKRKMCSKLEKK